MNFEAISDNIKGLFTSTRVYQIPRFQREFSWEQTNYNEFLNDMLSQITYNQETNTFEDSQYFLGNMLFLGRKESELVEVVDGQQRITSITILLAALRNTLFNVSKSDSDLYTQDQKNAAHNYAETIQQEYLIKKIDGTPQRKVETTSSFPYFTQTIQDYETRNPEVKPSTEEEELLEKTFKFFGKQLEKDLFLKKISERYSFKFKEEHYVNALKALRDQVLKAQIIEVFVAEKDQANRIFENINSKGKPLSQVDLIKNSIFSRINMTGAGIDEIAYTWSNFRKRIMNLDTTFEEFFLHYWKAVYPLDQATGTNLYKKFLDRFGAKTDQELKEFVKGLEQGLELYIKILSPDSNEFKRKETKPEYEYLQAIKRFKGVQVRPALLSFYIIDDKLDKSGENKKLSRDQRNKFFRMLSTFHFAAFGTNLKIRSNIVTKPYRVFSEEVSKANTKVDFKKAIDNLQSKLFKIIPKDKFIDAFAELEFTKKKNKNNEYESYPASYAVTQIANSLDNRKENDDEYTIEHILDESLGNTKNVGNLTVLELKYNIELNKIKQKNNNEISFEQKMAIYKNSKYPMVSELCDEYTQFSKDDISKRAKELAELFWESYFK
ncbi:DUF262 domain-containing protein [Bacillus mobilis]|uniref:DUF262 domain-containing protein n=1 Tax=Bacillus mobilis TaxID=2026190 RepID=UPI0013D2EC4A|nr:DUF262 domain-containing protein [Bacillus mobilis]NEL00397.1 DUF262 domain-containing protein [Bacillus mobilis]